MKTQITLPHSERMELVGGPACGSYVPWPSNTHELMVEYGDGKSPYILWQDERGIVKGWYKPYIQD